MKAADVLGTRAFAKLEGSRARKPLAAWLADERLGTFVVGAQGRSPQRGDLWQMRMLHEHDEKLAGGSASSLKVRAACLDTCCCVLSRARQPAV